MSVLVEKFDSRLVEREFETFYYSRIKKITTAGLVALSFYMAQDFFLNRDVFFSLLIPCILTLSVFYLCLIGAKKKLGPPDSLFLLFILSALGLTYTGIMFYENSYRIYTQTLIMLAFIFVPAGTGTILIGALFNILGTTFLALFVTPELFDQFEKVHIFILTLILAGVIVYFGISNKKKTYMLFEQRQIIEFEKKRVEQLLQNILPEKIIEELKVTGKTIPKTYTNVSFLFADIVGFTPLSKQLTPEELINTLSELFTKFDRIMDEHNCDRIKTIGDSYMAVSGLLNFKQNSAVDLVHAALEMIGFLEKRNSEGSQEIKIRIGIHTGTAIGGVVGIKRYAFDIFGNDVNIAARMESYGEVMKVNCSSKTYEYANGHFAFKERELMAVKGVGEERMYLLDPVSSTA